MKVDGVDELIHEPGCVARPLKLLYAEDDADDAYLCLNLLAESNINLKADVVASREGFLAALRSTEYDLVLTDYRLPGWSGIEVLQILQADSREIPCIMVTGSVGEAIAAECIKQGATDYILKDRPARLALAVKRALEEKGERAKRAAAERMRRRLASIVESSPDAIIGVGEDGRIISWNPGAECMFGYSAEAVQGSPLAILFNADKRERAAGAKDAAIQRYETTGIRKDGEMIDVAVTLSPIRDTEGRLDGSSAIIRDVTEAKRLQNEFLTAQKLEAIGQLAGGVAHDFNNLLTVINGYSRMLRRKGGIADPAKLDAIVQAGERGQRLTKQLLGFSRKQITDFKLLNLNSLILGFLDMVKPLLGADVELRTALAPGLAWVLADAGQMEQVIMNLVVNARDAMSSGGTITIETRNLAPAEAANDSGAVILAVSDTGVGMSPEIQARIFEPLFTTKEIGRGTGLGLSTSIAIINHCQGHLRVASQVGHGTTFTIQLPARAELVAERDSQAIVNERAPVAGTGNVLVAEDDPTVRGFIVSVLEDQGYRVLAAENGAVALETCATYTGSIDTLITDVVMPELNGRDLAARARLVRPNLKVLFVSGYVNRELTDEDVSDPSCRFLEKPFTGEALLAVVGHLCGAGSMARH